MSIRRVSSNDQNPLTTILSNSDNRYLIEGFDNDDIYMMVEDEFYAVAQSFTKHLHFAEYVRQAKEAKSHNASRIQDLARPTDGVTPMSEETKKKKGAESLAERQKKDLGMLENNERSREGKEEDDDDVFQDDSWAGTSLYDLMMSPRRTRTLVGAQRIKSSTRAAAGFVQSSQNSSAGGIAVPGLSSSPLGRTEQELRGSIQETASEDDDLEVQPTTAFKRRIEDIKTPKTGKSEESITPTPARSISHAPNNTIKKPKPEMKPIPTPTPSINTAGNKTKPSPSPFKPKPRRRMLFDDFDELPEPASNISMQEQKRKSSSSIEKSASGREESKKKSWLNEVPMFVL